MSLVDVAREQAQDPRAGCRGIAPLRARLEPWQVALLQRPGLITDWLSTHASPVNVIDPSPMRRNAQELHAAAARCGVDLGIFFSRAANKSLALVDEAHRLGLGVGIASEHELDQVSRRGLPGDSLVVTAAVKTTELLELCAATATTVVIDNTDELSRYAAIARDGGRTVPIALRLAIELGAGAPPTRFGMGMTEAIRAAEEHCEAQSGLRIDGVHFHLDGHGAGDRLSAIAQSLELVDALRLRGHAPTFIDIGGGIPMSYLDSAQQWARFWAEHRRALLVEREPLTFDGHGLGYFAHDGRLIGEPTVYPSHQSPVRGEWLTRVLTGPVDGGCVAGALRERGLRLHCQPGRALLDGCGLTAARVEFRKQRSDGTWLIGLAMNRAQCGSTSEDFLVDPLLIRPDGDGESSPTEPIEGYLVGAACVERDLLTWRRMTFPEGVAVGDIIVFPNTAGELMRTFESSSRQTPPPRNLVVDSELAAELDPIDR